MFLVVTVVAVPAALVVAFRYWPKTPMGRRLLLDVPSGDEVLPDSPAAAAVAATGRQAGRGQERDDAQRRGAGRRPDDRRAERGDADRSRPAIEVIEVRGTRVLVRPADDERRAASDDVLSQPIESLGLDSLEDPLA